MTPSWRCSHPPGLVELDCTAVHAHRHRLASPHRLEEDGGVEVVLPQRKVGLDAQIALAQGDKNRNLQELGLRFYSSIK
jgi:hypothetical protein